MISTLEDPRTRAAKRQWSDPSRRARILAAQILAAERRRCRKLVLANLDLLPLAAGHWAHRYPSLDKDDLHQAAYFGLRRAAETWDPTHESGAAFRTFAYWSLQDYCQREIHAMRSTIRVPKRASVPAPHVSSLDAQRADGLADDDAETPLDLAHSSEVRERVREALGHLRPNQRAVIALRWGLDGQPPLLLREVAARLGVSSERVRQIEKDALAHLAKHLSAFDE